MKSKRKNEADEHCLFFPIYDSNISHKILMGHTAYTEASNCAHKYMSNSYPKCTKEDELWFLVEYLSLNTVMHDCTNTAHAQDLHYEYAIIICFLYGEKRSFRAPEIISSMTHRKVRKGEGGSNVNQPP